MNSSNVTSSNVRLSTARLHRCLRAMGRRWAGYLLKAWGDAAAAGTECYMRRPGERMPPPRPPRGGGPRRDRRPDDWELAA